MLEVENMDKELEKRFDDYFYHRGEWAFLDKAPILVPDELKRYIYRFFPNLIEDFKSYLLKELDLYALAILEQARPKERIVKLNDDPFYKIWAEGFDKAIQEYYDNFKNLLKS